MYTLQLGTIYTNHNSFSPGGPIPHNLAWALMPRQPYSEAVPSTEKVRLHPRFLRKRGLGRKWSPLWKEGLGDSKNQYPKIHFLRNH